MATIPKAGITTSSTIEAAHVTDIIDALDGTTSREIKIPGSMQVTGAVQVTGSLDTKGVNTHTNANTFSGTVTVNQVFDLSSQASEFRRRLQVLDNSTDSEVSLTDYAAGTAFEIDLGESAANTIKIDIPDCPLVNYNIEYNIRFCRAAGGVAATFRFENSGTQRVYGLNCNTNAAFAINGSSGTATTSQTDLIYSYVKINNVQNANVNPFWQMRVWSNHSALFTIA
jgi:hypothetical protein